MTDKVVLPTGEKAGAVVTTDSPAADPANESERRGVRRDSDGRPLYEWEVDPKKQVGPAAQQLKSESRSKTERHS